MNDITPKEASEILSHYTDLGYGIVIEGEDTSKIKQALSFESKTLTNGTQLYINVPSANCISREAVRSKIWKERVEKDEGCNSEYIRGLKTAIAFIDNEPPVEPERPQGEWIIVKDEKWGDNVKCPFCGKELAGTDLNFCCKCGADMRGGAK